MKNLVRISDLTIDEVKEIIKRGVLIWNLF